MLIETILWWYYLVVLYDKEKIFVILLCRKTAYALKQLFKALLFERGIKQAALIE